MQLAENSTMSLQNISYLGVWAGLRHLDPGYTFHILTMLFYSLHAISTKQLLIEEFQHHMKRRFLPYMFHLYSSTKTRKLIIET